MGRTKSPKKEKEKGTAKGKVTSVIKKPPNSEPTTVEATDSTSTTDVINGDSDETKTTEMAEEEEILMIELSIRNLPSQVTVSDITTLLGLNETPFLEKTCSVQLTGAEGERMALLSLPENVATEVLKLNGKEAFSRNIAVTKTVNVQEETTESYAQVSTPSSKTSLCFDMCNWTPQTVTAATEYQQSRLSFPHSTLHTETTGPKKQCR